MDDALRDHHARKNAAHAGRPCASVSLQSCPALSQLKWGARARLIFGAIWAIRLTARRIGAFRGLRTEPR